MARGWTVWRGMGLRLYTDFAFLFLKPVFHRRRKFVSTFILIRECSRCLFKRLLAFMDATLLKTQPRWALCHRSLQVGPVHTHPLPLISFFSRPPQRRV